MSESPFYAGFPYVKLKIPIQEFFKIPRSWAYKHEYWDEYARLAPRPSTRDAILRLDTFVQRPHPVARVRALKEDEWANLPPLFHGGFAHELPFNQLEEEEAQRLAEACVAYTRDGADGRVIKQACVVIEHEEELIGAALITESSARRVWWASKPPRPENDVIPHLTWIFVDRWRARRGLGGALLSAVVERLMPLGYDVLASTFLLANPISMLWHWQMGFELIAQERYRIYQGDL